MKSQSSDDDITIKINRDEAHKMLATLLSAIVSATEKKLAHERIIALLQQRGLFINDNVAAAAELERNVSFFLTKLYDAIYNQLHEETKC